MVNPGANKIKKGPWDEQPLAHEIIDLLFTTKNKDIRQMKIQAAVRRTKYASPLLSKARVRLDAVAAGILEAQQSDVIPLIPTM